VTAAKRTTTIEAGILAALRSAGRPCTRGELRLYPGLACHSPGELGTALRALMAAGLIAPAVTPGVERACVKGLAAFVLAGTPAPDSDGEE
jgi:hypothetical protein